MKTQLALVTAMASLFAAGTANALVIDDFSVSQPNIYLTGPAPNISNGNIQFGSTANIVGGARQTDVALYAGNAVADVNIRVIGGLLDINNSVSAGTQLDMIWNANGAGLGNVNMFDGGSTGIYLAFPTAMDHALLLTFAITDNETALVATHSRTFPAGAQGSDFFFSFSDFTNISALSSADSIHMSLDSTTPGLDANLDLIETRDAPPLEIPEPGSISLLGLGLVGLRAMRRKTKSL